MGIIKTKRKRTRIPNLSKINLNKKINSLLLKREKCAPAEHECFGVLRFIFTLEDHSVYDIFHAFPNPFYKFLFS